MNKMRTSYQTLRLIFDKATEDLFLWTIDSLAWDGELKKAVNISGQVKEGINVAIARFDESHVTRVTWNCDTSGTASFLPSKIPRKS